MKFDFRVINTCKKINQRNGICYVSFLSEPIITRAMQKYKCNKSYYKINVMIIINISNVFHLF